MVNAARGLTTLTKNLDTSQMYLKKSYNFQAKALKCLNHLAQRLVEKIWLQIRSVFDRTQFFHVLSKVSSSGQKSKFLQSNFIYTKINVAS